MIFLYITVIIQASIWCFTQLLVPELEYVVKCVQK